MYRSHIGFVALSWRKSNLHRCKDSTGTGRTLLIYFSQELLMRFPIVAVALTCFASLSTAQTAANWNYFGKTGPLGWGKLDPSYKACSNGHEQSPLDIRGVHLNKSLQPIEFHYLAGTETVENNGRTIVVHVNPGSYMVAGGTRYNLVQYELRTPSEEAVKGKLTDMSVQFLHKSADGQMAIVAVRLAENQDAPNAALATLFSQLPRKSGDTVKIADLVNPGGFLPADRAYWTYMGSLTTPPCTEGVHWFVFQQPVTLSRTQLRTYGAMFRMNTRPLQDAHGREIEANQ
jgi:carbonic anhydrase